eukprot:scaffold85053_cov35-Phaeocystis_antarctica.AAC.2
MRWLYQRAAYALTSWRELAEAGLRRRAALSEWRLHQRAMRSAWLWWVGRLGDAGQAGPRRGALATNPNPSHGPGPDLSHGSNPP